MSVALVINGVTYDYPEVDDTGWGAEATDWASAVTSGMLQKAGGLFQLLAEVDLGTAFGVKSLYYKSRTANPADAGQMRLARADVINWRNNANDGNLSLGVSASDVLQFDGADIQGSISVSDTATINLTFSADTLSADIINDSITNLMVNASAAIAYSKLNLSGSLLNSDVSASAAIAYSKLNLSGSLLNSDVNASAAIAYSKLDLSASLVNADVSASAAIAFSKLAALASANILVGSAGNVATSVAVTGDVTISNAGVTAIGANKVTNSQLAQMAQSTIKGRAASAGTGDPVDLTATQATAILNNLVGDSGSGGTKGLAPAPAAGDAAAGKFLKADGTWTAPSGAGDVVGPGSSTDSGFAKFDGTTGKLLKNSAATIANADVAAAAAIAVNKLAALTASRAVVSDGSGFISAATTTATEIGYVNGVTSAIQTQINTKLPITITTTGDMIYSSSGTTAARLAIGGTGTYQQVISGLPAWGYVPYRSVTTTDSPTLADEILVCSGNSFTMTLPTAASVTGKIFKIVHNGTSFTQLYTLATTSGQTIGGVASGSYILATNGEALVIVSNGSNWIILEHKTTTAWTSYTPALTGFGSGGTAPTSVSGFWKREGDSMRGRVTWIVGTVTSVQAKVGIPSGPTIDSAKMLGFNTIVGLWYLTGTNTGTSVPTSTRGPCNLTFDSADNTTLSFAQAADTTNTGYFSVTRTGTQIAGNGTTHTAEFLVPITNWQP